MDRGTHRRTFPAETKGKGSGVMVEERARGSALGTPCSLGTLFISSEVKFTKKDGGRGEEIHVQENTSLEE